MTCDDRVEVLRERLLGRFVYADEDLPMARRCLHALIEIVLAGTGTGGALGGFGPDGAWTPGFASPGWSPRTDVSGTPPTA